MAFSLLDHDFDNPSVIRTRLTSEGRKGWRVEVYRGRDVLISAHPKLVKSFKRAFQLGESMQDDAHKAFEI